MVPGKYYSAMKTKDDILLEQAYNQVKRNPIKIPFDHLPEEAKEDARVQGYDEDLEFVFRYLSENDILNIFKEKELSEDDIAIWKNTKHYQDLKKDIAKNGIKIPALGYEGVHRMLIALELGIPLPYYEPVLDAAEDTTQHKDPQAEAEDLAYQVFHRGLKTW